jgi:hypothetical protein
MSEFITPLFCFSSALPCRTILVAATLSAGQVVNFGLYINAQHGGRHWFSVCPLPRQQATQACFDKPEHQLVRADGSYGDGKRYYYMLGSGWGGKEGDYVLK